MLAPSGETAGFLRFPVDPTNAVSDPPPSFHGQGARLGATGCTPLRTASLRPTCRCSGPSNGAPSDCRRRLRFEPNSADPSCSFPRAANPPCRHRKALLSSSEGAQPPLRPLHLVGRETEFCGQRLAGDFRRRMRENGRNSVRRPRIASLTDRNCECFSPPGNRVGSPARPRLSQPSCRFGSRLSAARACSHLPPRSQPAASSRAPGSCRLGRRAPPRASCAGPTRRRRRAHRRSPRGRSRRQGPQRR